jgi:hypothetical protein
VQDAADGASSRYTWEVLCPERDAGRPPWSSDKPTNRCNSGSLGNQISIAHAFVGIAIRSLSQPKIGLQYGGFRDEGLCECNCRCAYPQANREGRSDCRSGVDVRIAASARYDDLAWSATMSETEGASSIFELEEFLVQCIVLRIVTAPRSSYIVWDAAWSKGFAFRRRFGCYAA